MPRLPVSGGDSGAWGDILNDFLLQSHTGTGELRAGTVGSSQLRSNSVSAAHIVNGAVSAANVAPDIATQADLSSAISGVTPSLGGVSMSSGTASVGIVNRYDASSGAITVTAPAVGAVRSRYLAMKTDASAHTVTVDGFVLPNQYSCVTFQSDGAVWVPVDFSAGSAQLTKVSYRGQYQSSIDVSTLEMQRGKAGDYLTPAGVQYSGVSMTPTTNREYALPFWIPTGLQITCVTFFVFTPAVGSQARIGIRADDAGYPGDLLYEAGTLGSTTSLWRPLFFAYTPPTNIVWVTLKFEGGAPAVASGSGLPTLATIALDPWTSPRGVPMGTGSAGAFPLAFPGARGAMSGAAGFPFVNINLG